ncbi:MAG: metal-sulfur cluster assembly factor [bacterium]
MITKEQVLDALKQVYDPEIPVNVVDLGLVYRVEIDEENQVYVEMTLTAPGCPMYGPIGHQAEEAIRRIPGVKDAAVNFVWDPPWDPSRISEEGKKILRSFGYLI